MRVIQAILIIAAAIAATHASPSSPSIPATPYALAINGPEAHLLVAGFPSPALFSPAFTGGASATG